jgi:hypothetical protein
LARRLADRDRRVDRDVLEIRTDLKRLLGEKVCPDLRELHIGPALVHPQQAALDSELDWPVPWRATGPFRRLVA